MYRGTLGIPVRSSRDYSFSQAEISPIITAIVWFIKFPDKSHLRISTRGSDADLLDIVQYKRAAQTLRQPSLVQIIYAPSVSLSTASRIYSALPL